jgi:mannose-1-phosphate guanylyltransferase
VHRRKANIYAVILVGGKGKRLRPLSTDRRPKAFLSVTSDRKTMFRKTLEGICRIIPKDRVHIVANKLHAGLVRKDFKDLRRGNLHLEPVGRNTAPAVMYAASVLQYIDPNAVMVVLPTDQYIKKEKEYLKAVGKGAEFVKRVKNAIVVLGIRPSSPATGLGYVKLMKAAGGGADRIYKVESFTEKPDLKKARQFLKSRKYMWNAGAFIFRVGAFLKAARHHAPEIYSAFMESGTKSIESIYRKLPDISIDYAIMEKAGNIYCVEGSYGWSDVGSFTELKKVLRIEGRQFTERGGKVIRIG